MIDGTFETWRPRPDEQFDLVSAATARHWIDSEVRYRRAWGLARPGGRLAFWSATHVIPEDGGPFFAGIQAVCDEIGEGAPNEWAPTRPGQLPDSRDEIEASGLFDVVAVRHFDWEISYNAEEYLQLLETFSNHIAMKPWQRDRLYGEIRRRLARRLDGRLRRRWGVVVSIAHRRNQPTASAAAKGLLAGPRQTPCRRSLSVRPRIEPAGSVGVAELAEAPTRCCRRVAGGGLTSRTPWGHS